MAAARKSSSPSNGNNVIVALLAIGLAVASIFTPWGNIAVTAEDISRHTDSILEQLGGALLAGLNGNKIPVDGQFPLKILGMDIPVWLFSSLVIAGAGIAAANAAKYAALPRAIPLILCGIGIAFALFMLLGVLDGGLGIGVLLFAAAAGLGMFVSLKKA